MLGMKLHYLPHQGNACVVLCAFFVAICVAVFTRVSSKFRNAYLQRLARIFENGFSDFRIYDDSDFKTYLLVRW